MIELDAERSALLARLLANEGIELVGRIPRRERADEPAPLSFGQQRLWFLHQLDPHSAAYNIRHALRLSGPLDLRALARSLGEVVRRHESLRTTFAFGEGGDPVQLVGPPLPFKIPLVDLRELPAAQRECRARELTEAQARSPFDLARGPLFRALALRTGERSHVLLFTMHHIVSDEWSTGVLIREAMTCYEAFVNGRAAALPELPIQYTDFAAWQRAQLGSAGLKKQLDYWRAQLGGDPPHLELPVVRPAPAVATRRDELATLALGREVGEALRELGRREGATLFMVLLAAFKLLLSRYTGQTDIVVGTPVAGRNRREVEPLIGFFVNTLALRTDLSGEPTFRELLGRVRKACLGAYANQDAPFDLLVEELRPERDLSRHPFFEIVFLTRNAPKEGLELPGVELSVLPTARGEAKFDLILVVDEAGPELSATLAYNTDLFNAADAERLLGHLRQLLRGIANDSDRRVSELPLLSKEERHQLIAGWNQTASDYPRHSTVAELFEEQAALTPEAIALLCGEERLTYAELNRRANQLAHYLNGTGVGPEVAVGLCLERSAEMVVALLAILKAGGFYVPVDPSYPHERLAFMLEDSRPRLLLTSTELAVRLPAFEGRLIRLDAERERIEREETYNPSARAGADNLCYVSYTSGSTGVPKGVAVTHRNVVRLVRGNWFAPLTSSDTVLQMAPLAFDASTFEIWGPLLSGARLAVMKPGQVSLEELETAIERYEVTALWLTAGLFHLVVDERPQALRRLKRLLAGGDALSAQHVRRVLEAHPGLVLVNGYGPTENTTFSCCHEVRGAADVGASVSIGRPIANSTAYVLDGRLEAAPVGVAGELYVGGDGVARGYLNRPALTAERFVPDPYSNEPGARLYKTGDVVRRLPDGNLEFLGRTDMQVKVRGFRVEPEEVEAALGRHPRVGRCAVVVKAGEGGDKLLAAYFVAERDGVVTEEELRLHLSRSLPEYMVPTLFVRLDELPLTPNGKVDRRALSARADERTAAEYVAPRTPAEEIVAGLFAEVLGLDRVGARDNFFALGGHSLSATKVVTRLRQAFRTDLPLRLMFETPTVSAVAASVESSLGEPGAPAAPALERAPRGGPLPLSYAQQRLWFSDQLRPGNAAYNIASAVHLSGPLDVTALRGAFNEIVRRHEALRTTFDAVKGQPVQVIAPELEVPLEVSDLRALPEREAEALRRATEEIRRPFDLARGPLLRVALLRTGDEEHLLTLVIHHIVGDGWSMSILVSEVVALYKALSRGEPSRLPGLPVQYADFAVWQREYLRGEVLERQLDYWRERLGRGLPVLRLPFDRPHPPIQSFRGAYATFALPPELSAALAEMSRREGVTLFMLMLAAFKVLLHFYDGGEDIVVGTDVANRARVETEGLIGFFANQLVLRTELSGDPGFTEVLARVRETALGAYAHQDVPFDKVVESLNPERDLSRNPLFQVMFGFRNIPAGTLSDGGGDLTISGVAVEDGTAVFDLSFYLSQGPAGLHCLARYSTDIFERQTVAQMWEVYEALLRRVVERPAERLGALRAALAEAARDQRVRVREELTETRQQLFRKVKRRAYGGDTSGATTSAEGAPRRAES